MSNMKDLYKTEPPNYRLHYTIKDAENAISSVKFSPSGEWIASCSYDRNVKIWDVPSGQLEADLVGHTAGVSEIDWSKDPNSQPQLLVSASDDKTLKIWNVDKGKCLRTLKGHTHNVFCTRFSSRSDKILSGSDDLSVKIWDTNTGKKLKTIREHTDRVSAVDFNSTGTLMLSSSYDGFCFVYDLASRKPIRTLNCKKEVSFARFSPNGKYILYATLDDTITLWDLTRDKYSKTYRGHKNKIFSIFANFSLTDEKCIVSGSEDNAIYIWNLNSEDLVETIRAHSAVVICVDCHPTKNIIVSGALDPDNSIKVWKS